MGSTTIVARATDVSGAVKPVLPAGVAKPSNTAIPAWDETAVGAAWASEVSCTVTCTDEEKPIVTCPPDVEISCDATADGGHEDFGSILGGARIRRLYKTGTDIQRYEACLGGTCAAPFFFVPATRAAAAQPMGGADVQAMFSAHAVDNYRSDWTTASVPKAITFTTSDGKEFDQNTKFFYYKQNTIKMTATDHGASVTTALDTQECTFMVTVSCGLNWKRENSFEDEPVPPRPSGRGPAPRERGTSLPT